MSGCVVWVATWIWSHNLGWEGVAENWARGAGAEVAGELRKGTLGSLCPVGSPVITILTLYRRLSLGAYSSASVNCLS